MAKLEMKEAAERQTGWMSLWEGQVGAEPVCEGGAMRLRSRIFFLG